MLSSDGCINVAVIDDPSCCPPPLCGNDLCCTFVAFFNLLPSGPLWDYWKAQAISYFERSDDPAQCPLLQDPRCPSMVLHAIYTVLKLRHMVHYALWPAFRESNPNTAVTTLDDHLARLNWENCYASHCRSATLGVLSPLEVMGECGPIFCEPNYPPEQEAALKRAVAVSLTRANMGVIKNLCGLNWIIDPLGAVLVPILVPACVDPPDPDGVEWPDMDVPCTEFPDEPCPDNCEPENSGCNGIDGTGMRFELCPSRSYLAGVGTGDVCDTLAPPPQVPAYFDWGCLDDRPAGVPDRVWPGVLAAECILRSLVPYLNCSSPVTLYQCCPEVVPA